MTSTVDSRFFWCRDLHRARTNYDERQCLQFALREIAQIEDIDHRFSLEVMRAKPENFTYDCRYLPVYNFEVKATYKKGNDLREVTNTGIYYDEELAGCRPDFFVGGKTARIEPVNLPRELSYPLYRPNAGGFDEKRAEEVAREFSEIPRIGERRVIDEWCAEVCFVPIVLIGYTYLDKQYYSLVNMHNGSCVTDVPKPRGDVLFAESAVKTAGKLKRAQVAIMLILPLIPLFLMWLPKAAFYADVACLALAVLHLFVRAARLPSTDFNDWLARRRQSNEAGFRALDRAKLGVFVSSVFAFLLVAADIVLQFVLK